MNDMHRLTLKAKPQRIIHETVLLMLKKQYQL